MSAVDAAPWSASASPAVACRRGRFIGQEPRAERGGGGPPAGGQDSNAGKTTPCESDLRTLSSFNLCLLSVITRLHPSLKPPILRSVEVRCRFARPRTVYRCPALCQALCQAASSARARQRGTLARPNPPRKLAISGTQTTEKIHG